jgi:hypothetical protein
VGTHTPSRGSLPTPAPRTAPRAGSRPCIATACRGQADKQWGFLALMAQWCYQSRTHSGVRALHIITLNAARLVPYPEAHRSFVEISDDTHTHTHTKHTHTHTQPHTQNTPVNRYFSPRGISPAGRFDIHFARETPGYYIRCLCAGAVL